MADKQIKDLTANASPALTDKVPVDNAANATYYDTVSQMLALHFNDGEGDPSNTGVLADGNSAYAAHRNHDHGVRERLTAARTYYVRTDGNDSNSGLANTAGGAFLTMQRAVDVCVKLDLNGYAVTIQVAAGTYAGGIHMTVPFLGGTVTVVGDTVTPSNVVCSSSAPLYLENGSILYFGGFKFTSAAATYAALVSSNSTLYINGKMEYATSGALAANGFGSILVSAPYTISAGGAVHYWPASNGVISASGLTITLTGTPPFSAAFAYATSMGNLSVFGNTFVGAATGKRYHADSNAVIFTDGGGANYLPGNVAGETASGGQYV